MTHQQLNLSSDAADASCVRDLSSLRRNASTDSDTDPPTQRRCMMMMMRMMLMMRMMMMLRHVLQPALLSHAVPTSAPSVRAAWLLDEPPPGSDGAPGAEVSLCSELLRRSSGAVRLIRVGLTAEV